MRAVRTWNPVWIAAEETDRRNLSAFMLVNVSDNHEHNLKDTTECRDCGAFLCEICQSDQHATDEGHDLSNPRYWGV